MNFQQGCRELKWFVQWNVVFFGQRNLTGSLKWMGAFWLSVAGGQSRYLACCWVAIHGQHTLITALLNGNLTLAEGAASSAHIQLDAVI